MALFRITDKSVKKLISKKLDLEKNIHTLFEENLEELLDITFLAHEYSTSFGGRIDSLGIDKNGSPCIIEYKKGQNDNVINQGLSYLRWLLDHKADFEKLLNSVNSTQYSSKTLSYNGEDLKSLKIDWDSPRVICIAESYNKFDIDTADLLPINIELLKFRIYDDNLLYLEAESFQKVNISTGNIIRKSKGKEIREKLQVQYTIDYHLEKADKKIQSLFYKLREKITSLDESIREEPKKLYIAYKTSRNFVDVAIFYPRGKDHYLKLWLNVKSGQLNDPDGIAKDLAIPKKIGHWGNGDYRVMVKSEKDIEPAFELIKQSYELNK